MRTQRNNRWRSILLAVTTAAMLMVPAFAAGEEAAGPGAYGTFLALLPPLVAIVLALITKEVYSSLFAGILVGALLYTNFSPVETMNAVVHEGMVPAVADTAGNFIFLVLLGSVVALVNASGGSAAFGRWAQRNIKSRVGAMLATFVLGILIFIDDYFNCLTVGAVMRPVTDSHRISRTKLAYLIDATAAPICMIAPVSSWAAAVALATEGLDIGVTGIQLFLRSIPYNFYSLLTFVFIIAITLMRFDYGPMQIAERAAILEGRLGALETETEVSDNPRGRVLDLIFPVIVLIILCVIAMIYVGGYFGVDHWGGTDFAGDLVGAFGNTDAFVALPWGGLITLMITIAYMVIRRVITFKDAMGCLTKGFVAMVPAITILTLAVSLNTMTGNLGADVFFATLMEGAASALYSLLPAVIFLAACILAFASGTSWGTFCILIPIVAAIFDSGSTLLFIGMSACLAGAVCGDHCSPISDTTIMSSAGAQCEHLDHVSTQIPYALTVAALSFVMYIIAGFVQNAVICLVVGVALTIGTLLVIRTATNKQD